MRICILTQPLGANYGGILQAFALQKVLKDMGHDVTTLRFRPEVSWVPSGFGKHVLTLRRFISKYLKGNKDIVCCNPDRQTRYAYRELDRFIEERMQCLEVKAPLSARDLPVFDAYVVGSDQVWRPAYSPCLPNFYLDFVTDPEVKRIAYAASFGVDKWEADEEMTALIRLLAGRFNAVSVREESGVMLCAEHLGVDAVLMPDPTFLLTEADYLALCRPKPKDQSPFIAAYFLDKGEKEQRFLERISKETGLPVRQIGLLDWAKCTDSLECWLEGISEASFVVTNSFHGTVFSILFEKNFLTVTNSRRGASRFTSLLKSVGLQARLISGDSLEDCHPELQDIDYTAAKAVLQSMREQGLTFLKASLTANAPTIRA